MLALSDALKGVWPPNGVGSPRFSSEIYALGLCCAVVLVVGFF